MAVGVTRIHGGNIGILNIAGTIERLGRLDRQIENVGSVEHVRNGDIDRFAEAVEFLELDFSVAVSFQNVSAPEIAGIRRQIIDVQVPVAVTEQGAFDICQALSANNSEKDNNKRQQCQHL